MSAASRAYAQPAVFAGQKGAQHMSSFMPCMCMAATAASITIFETGVITSVSFIALVLSLVLTLVLLGSLLALSCLTGLIDLVGLIKELDARTMQGD